MSPLKHTSKFRRLNRLPPLRARDYASAALSGLPSAESYDRIRFYGYGRQALHDALRLCGCMTGDTVLYPETICDVTLEPVHRLGLRVAFYPVSDAFLPDWENLQRLIAHANPRVIVSVNYFGFPQPMDRWQRLAKETETAWINDNAHGYGSSLDGIALESFGDVSVTSMRKVLPLINGASLRVNRPDWPSPACLTQPAGIRARLPNPEEWRRIARSAAAALLIAPIKRSTTIPYQRMPDPAEYDARVHPMGAISRRVLKRLDRQSHELACRRRQIYEIWHRHCTASNLRPVFPELPDEASPMVFPCHAESFTERQKWLRWAEAKNVDVYPWPSLPMACRQKGSPAVDRWERLLCFPIHAEMNEQEIGFRWT